MQHMLERLNERRNQDGGFTLIELLVVIVIIGILAGVVVFAVSGIGDRGQDSACESDERAIRTAAEAYLASPDHGNGNYAAAEGDLVPDFLSETSDLHAYAGVGSPATSYTVTATGDCA
jgi:general secretion pathway protein G